MDHDHHLLDLESSPNVIRALLAGADAVLASSQWSSIGADAPRQAKHRMSASDTSSGAVRSADRKSRSFVRLSSRHRIRQNRNM